MSAGRQLPITERSLAEQAWQGIEEQGELTKTKAEGTQVVVANRWSLCSARSWRSKPSSSEPRTTC